MILNCGECENHYLSIHSNNRRRKSWEGFQAVALSSFNYDEGLLEKGRMFPPEFRKKINSFSARLLSPLSIGQLIFAQDHLVIQRKRIAFDSKNGRALTSKIQMRGKSIARETKLNPDNDPAPVLAHLG